MFKVNKKKSCKNKDYKKLESDKTKNNNNK